MIKQIPSIQVSRSWSIKRALCVIGLFLCFIAPVSAEEKYTLFEHEVLSAIRGLWPIMTATSGSNKHELELPPEKFSKLMTRALADVYELSYEHRLLLLANKPIRDPKKYFEIIDAFPEKQWSAEAKKMIKDWVAVENRTEGEKEAMLALLIVFEPRTEPEKVLKGEIENKAVKKTEGVDKVQTKVDKISP